MELVNDTVEMNTNEAPQPAAAPVAEKVETREDRIMKASGFDKDGNQAEQEPKAIGDGDVAESNRQESGDSKPPQKEPGQKPVKKYANGYEKEIARMTRQKERMRQELDELRREVQGIKQSPQEGPQRAMKRSEFANDDEYLAYREAELERRIIDRQQELGQVSQQRQGLASSWNEKVTASFKTEEDLQDYAETIREFGNPSERLPHDAVSYIFQHPQGPAILKEIADHPKFVSNFAKMHPYDQQASLREIAAWVRNGRQTTATTQPASKASNVVSKAKAIGTVGNAMPAKPVNELGIAEMFSRYRKTGKLQ